MIGRLSPSLCKVTTVASSLMDEKPEKPEKFELESLGTTRLPEGSQDDPSASGDSMDTGTSSKKSQSRPECQRGPTRKERKRKRAQDHRAAQGGVWIPQAELEQQVAEAALPGSSMRGSIAVSSHSQMLEEKQQEPLPEGEEKKHLVEEALVKDIPVEMSRWVQMVDGEPRCLVCKKVATEGHLNSGEHLKRIEEDAIGTLMAGVATTTRRFNGDMCTGVPTKKKMYDFWGNSLENMVKVAKDIHAQKGVFYDDKKEITPEEAHYELGVISYPGSGKYKNSIYVPFHELPDVEEIATEEQKKVISPPGQGWWPVIALQTEVVSETERKKLIVCWYQLLSDGRVICWWIYI